MRTETLILVVALFLIPATDSRAHNLITANGNNQAHQHVFRHQAYGKPLQQGHLYQSSGGSGTITWGSNARPEYGKPTLPQSGPIIGNQKTRAGVRSHTGKKFGSTVNGYGKGVKSYGKTVNEYGKPVRYK